MNNYSIAKYGKKVQFQIWDTAGQEKYRGLTKIFYKDAKIVILVYDITKRQSFDEINELRNVFQPAVMVICAWFGGDNPTMKMLQENYKDLYEDMHRKNHQVILRYAKGDKEIDEEDKVKECISKILEIVNQETV